MFPSYQTIPLANVPTKANAPKDERASTPVLMKKKVAVAVMMVGMALLVVGYSYGSSTTNPARIDIATTTMTVTTTSTCREFKCHAVDNGVPFDDKPACKKDYCENTLNGIFTISDTQCHPVPFSHPSCSINITCVIPCPPRPVPSDSDKRRYGVTVCGAYRDSNGHEVSLQEVIFKGGNYNPRGFGKYDSRRGSRLVHSGANFLWGGSCGGTCGGSSAHPTCTF